MSVHVRPRQPPGISRLRLEVTSILLSWAWSWAPRVGSLQNDPKRSQGRFSVTYLLTYLLIRTFTVRRERTWPRRTVSGHTCHKVTRFESRPQTRSVRARPVLRIRRVPSAAPFCCRPPPCGTRLREYSTAFISSAALTFRNSNAARPPTVRLRPGPCSTSTL